MPDTYAVLDVETSIYQQGHPFSARNKLCLVGIRLNNANHIFDIEYTDMPYGKSLGELSTIISKCSDIVGFNLKFDLNWLARYGIILPDHVRVFDCQLAEFILSNQSTPFPSLDDCCIKYGLARKLDVVSTEYWDRGIDTTEVPREILVPYLQQDLEITDVLYPSQLRLLDDNQKRLIVLHNSDLRILQEMEFNGIQLNWSAMEQRAKETEKELNVINQKILEFVPGEGREFFNTSSNDHISLLLYGGRWQGKAPRPYLHTYQSGSKAGTSETRNKWEDIHCEFRRLVAPLPNTELAKDGFWSTGADVLRELGQPKALITLLLKQAELSKLLDTYYHGFRAVRDKMDWQDGCIHSQLNQCVARTGRLSSSRPNQQNMPEAMNKFIVSRFK